MISSVKAKNRKAKAITQDLKYKTENKTDDELRLFNIMNENTETIAAQNAYLKALKDELSNRH